MFTSLRPDDVGGRDALYPIPEPATGALAAAALAALALLRRRVERG